MAIVMNSSQFAARYRKDIRVRLNWNRLLSENWRVEINVITDSKRLEMIFLPWYLKFGTFESHCFDRIAVPVRVCDVFKCFNGFSDTRKIAIAEHAARFRSMESLTFNVPMYCIDASEYLLLDCCHRICGLSLCQVPFRVIAWILYGPLDSGALPDLHYWQYRLGNS